MWLAQCLPSARFAVLVDGATPWRRRWSAFAVLVGGDLQLAHGPRFRRQRERLVPQRFARVGAPH
eukprot:9102-Lingulodinium_polyedra.AAC.1